MISLKKVQGVHLINLDIYKDERGSFESIWEHHKPLTMNNGFTPSSVNISHNIKRFTLRGMHFQCSPFSQAKVVACANGTLWDVVVDLRQESSTYKNWMATELTNQSGKALYIPKGCAHGYITLEENTSLIYLIDGTHMPEQSRVFRWDDSEFSIDWPVEDPILSDRDRLAPDFLDS